jgi:hypothetical protein
MGRATFSLPPSSRTTQRQARPWPDDSRVCWEWQELTPPYSRHTQCGVLPLQQPQMQGSPHVTSSVQQTGVHLRFCYKPSRQTGFGITQQGNAPLRTHIDTWLPAILEYMKKVKSSISMSHPFRSLLRNCGPRPTLGTG